MSPRITSEANGEDIEKEPMLEWQATKKSWGQQYRRTVFIVLLTFVVSTAGFTILYHGFSTPSSVAASSGATKLAGEVNGLVPEFPLSAQVWSNNSLYGPEDDIRDLPQAEIDQLMKRWKDLMPRGYGFVPVHEPEKYTLAPPLQYDGLPPPDYYYSITVFHQMHCLDAILHTFVSDRTGFSHGAHDKREEQHFHHSRHILHCFDYLRQAIMCYGDTALEGADPYSIAEGRDKVTIGTSGIGTTHMCKNYDDIKSYAEEHANPRWKRPLEKEH
ncbi:Putative mycotoxin biosynthesis protein UstYa [Septoria linicola]|uniref:Mycotoxin biosynthesis protein UstYa n=1 Tax=Septoria linicola TaxID=215465 RepID=A0A9Q9B9D9_9PEZI|nr:putative mycotoxin biosynthesis protein UstYa [Septoria linicola]USW59466.1 Putative mycotoxin biosynthesis protein UstYa [Septoria linicola]